MTPDQWQHAETAANEAAGTVFRHDILWLALVVLAVATCVYLWRDYRAQTRRSRRGARIRGGSGR